MGIEIGPEFRIVGGASQEKKEEEKEKLHEALFNHFESLSSEDQKKMEKFEYNKSEKTKELIDFANEETNKLRQEAGVKPYIIPHENYHLLPSKLYKEIARRGEALTSYSRQGILMDADTFRSYPLHLGSTLLHETIHLKGNLAFEVEEREGKITMTPFRGGVSAYGTQGKEPHEHFLGLHEAIVASQEKKLVPKMLNLPFFQKEREWLMSDEAKKIRQQVAEETKIPEDEFMWVDKKKEWEGFSYFPQRQVLDYVCSEIQKEYPQQYQDKDEVSREFLKSHFTGQLLRIARLVEKTFGEGSFRALGNMMTDKESAILHTELLRKARVRQLKKEKIQ